MSKRKFNKSNTPPEENEPKRPREGWLFPGHNWLGPGNPIDDAPAVDKADEVARTHDIAYSHAHNFEDIRTADRQAMHDFPVSVPGVVGTIGLALKYAAETVAGPIYPREFNTTHPDVVNYSLTDSEGEIEEGETPRTPFSKGVKRASTPETDELRHLQPTNSVDSITFDDTHSDTIRPNLDVPGKSTDTFSFGTTTQGQKTMADNTHSATINAAQDMDTDFDFAEDNSTGRGSGGTGSNGPKGSKGIPAILNVPRLIQPTNKMVFHKTFLVSSWAYAYQKMEIGKNYVLITTPLACIPTDALPTYISPTEYFNLPQTAVATQAYIQVKPVGYRCSFSTGTSTSNMANSAHSLYLVTGVGLNAKTFSKHYAVGSIDASTPMKVTALADCFEDNWSSALYGTTNHSDSLMPVCVGSHRELTHYLGIAQHATQAGFQNIRNFLSEYELNSVLNTPVVAFKHRFHNGTLKHLPAVGISNADKDVNKTVVGQTVFANSVTTGQRQQVQVNGKNNTVLQLTQTHKVDRKPITFSYQTCIEKFGTGHLNDQSMPIDKTPNVYIGLQPVASNTPLAKDDYTNASGHYSIQTQLEVIIKNDSDFTQYNAKYLWHCNNFGFDQRSWDQELNQLNCSGLVGF